MGWLGETAWTGNFRTSLLFGHAKIPLIPVYGVGGVLVGELQPILKQQNIAIRFVSYSALLTALEYLACKISDLVVGETNRAWHYEHGDPYGCIAWQYSLLWGILGLAVEPVDAELKEM